MWVVKIKFIFGLVADQCLGCWDAEYGLRWVTSMFTREQMSLAMTIKSNSFRRT